MLFFADFFPLLYPSNACLPLDLQLVTRHLVEWDSPTQGVERSFRTKEARR